VTGNSPTPPDPYADAPLESFSHCHDGIIAHLGGLDELPVLAEAASRAQELAAKTLHFFAESMLTHHEEEERELFTAVTASAKPGDEAREVRSMVERLTREHREVEAMWHRLVPQLKRLSSGHVVALDVATAAELVKKYKAHADFEESVFLPLCQVILGRNGSHMAALGLSLHMRHVQKKLPHI
jgi:hemerythrin-like domain-containing protein